MNIELELERERLKEMQLLMQKVHDCQSVIQRLRWYLEKHTIARSIFDENNKMDKSVFIFSTQLIIKYKHLQNCDLEVLCRRLQTYWQEYVFSKYYDADTSYLQSIHDFLDSTKLSDEGISI